MSALEIPVIVLNAIIKMANQKESCHETDTEAHNFGLHANFFNILDWKALVCKARGLYFVMDLTARAQVMTEDNNLT